MKKNLLFACSILCFALVGCQQNSSSGSMFVIQPKTSSFYTSVSSGSNGPAYQLLTVTNTQNAPLTIKNIAFTQTNASIKIAARTSAIYYQVDNLYGALPECGTQATSTTVNTLTPNQTCGILLQGVTYDPRQAEQAGQLQVGVTVGNNNVPITQNFNLTDTTHIYASANSDQIGAVTVSSGESALADCSNSTATAGQPLTCTNALGSNSTDNFLSKPLGEIRIFPNGNLIFAGTISQAGNANNTGGSGVYICQPDTDQCQNALANGAYFYQQNPATGSPAPAFVSEVELDASGLNGHAPNTAFFVTGGFDQIKDNDGNIVSGTPDPANAPYYGYFVAYCVIGGACVNIMPQQYIIPHSTAGYPQIYGLALNNLTDTVYFAGGFAGFSSGVPSSSGNPIIQCKFNGSTCQNYTNYFTSSSANANESIFGLTSIDSTNQLEVSGFFDTIAGVSSSSPMAALCDNGNCQSVTANVLTFRGAYDSNSNLLYLPIDTDGSQLGAVNLSTAGATGGLLAACAAGSFNDDPGSCFDVLGGGVTGAFNHGIYPTLRNNGTTRAGIVANVGAQLTVTAGS